MKLIKQSIIMLVGFILAFINACTTTTYETSDVLLDSSVNHARSTSSLKSSILLPTVVPVPQNISFDNSFPKSSYIGSNLIAEQDLLSINVYRNPDLNRTLRVDSNGNINIPLLSKVHAKGLSATELAQKIKKGLEKDDLVEAHVNVLIKQSSKDQFTIEGAVKKSGVYPVTGKTTLLQAIAHAGGLSKDADEHHATLLRRRGDGEVVQQAIDIAAIRRGQLQDFLLMQGDRIVIQKAIYNRVTVSGAVVSPGIFPLTEGITVLQSITLAGGVNALAHKDHVVLFRRNIQNKSFNKYRVNLQAIRSGFNVDPEVHADDRVVVLESKQKVLLEEMIRILSPLSAIKALSQ